MSWFLVYLFVSIEKIAALFMSAKALIFWPAILAFAVVFIIFLTSHTTEGFKSRLGEFSKFFKWCKRIFIVGVICVILGTLLPNKKELAIIVVAGGAWEMLQTDTAKEIGGDALNLIKKEIKDALGEDPVKTSVKAVSKAGSAVVESAKKEAAKEVTKELTKEGESS